MRRIHCDSATWHVFARGARRLELFRDDQDCGQFINLLVAALRISGCALWGFALMPNHYHLVLHASSDQLTACMRRVGAMYSKYHNSRYGLSGHAFDGPYQAWRQRSPILTLRTLAYVLLNPLKGGLCRHPEDYPWSGVRSYLGLEGSPIPINVTKVMAAIDPDPAKAWSRFHEAMRAEAKRPAKQHPHRLTMVEVHVQQFEWLLEFAESHPEFVVPEETARSVAVYWARQRGISPRAIAVALGLPGSDAVRNIMRHWEKRIAREPGLKEAMATP